MHYVIIRDDDTNAFTRPEWLDKLYQPFLVRDLPVHLAVIPDVSTTARRGDGKLEGFLLGKNGENAETVALGENAELVAYLRREKQFRVVQHGCHHDYREFETASAETIPQRLERGAKALASAGFARPETFVAPHDKFTPLSFREVAQRFSVISTGWFELNRLPTSWLPRYALKKMLHRPHWRANGTTFLSHPGCLLSRDHDYKTMLDTIRRQIESQRLTVLVTHWWEYFPDGKPDEAFINILHDTAAYLAADANIKVVSFADVANGSVPLS